ncbi:MAG: T9SS type A sorting domain-containing protein [Paludibacter sp.]|nr:T9SS type A sorting domain-containing protein [Paludibacter sp.]
MKTKNILSKYSRMWLVLVLCLFASMEAKAQVTAPGQVWQWSVDVIGGINSGGPSRAYMWIPPNCAKVRGMMLAQNNMQEFSILENQQFRDSLASIGFGEVWVSPAFNPFYNVQEGAREVFMQMMIDLANASGYQELKNVPMVPIGHSAMSNFNFAFTAGSPERTLCGVSTDGDFCYDFGNPYCMNTECGATSDYIPQLTTIGEFEGAGDASTNFTKIFNRRHAHPYTPETFLPVSGEYHFATSQRKTNFIAYYIKKVAKYRLAVDATATSLATLTPIDPTTTGWLVDRWRKNMLPRYPAAPVASYTGKMALIGTTGEENFWCFDQDMASRIESIEGTYYRKTPCLLAYNQSSTAGFVGPQVPQNNNHVQVHLNFYPLNDSLDFELSSSFLDTIPAASGRCVGWMSTTDLSGNVTNGVVGAHITHPADNSLSVIDREIGPISKLRRDPVTGITTFRMTLERGLPPTMTNYVQYCIFSVAHPGDATFKASVLQSEMGIAVNNTSGLTQTITFPQIANVANVDNQIPLNAVSNLGLPVQYFIKEGPAQLLGNKLVFTQIPPSSKYPVKVTVVAWQWGRDAGLASRVASKAPYAGQTVQTATPIENTFYVLSNLQPVVDLSNLTATLMNQNLISLNWTTITELYNTSYEVQKSLDNSTWSTFGTVIANGAGSTYQFNDSNPANGYNYYRLKVNSSDLSYTYSNVISVLDGFTTAVEKIVDADLTLAKIGNIIQIKGGKENSNLLLTIYDNMGRAIFVKSDRFSPSGINETQLTDLTKGIYIIQVKNDAQIKSLKIIID